MLSATKSVSKRRPKARRRCGRVGLGDARVVPGFSMHKVDRLGQHKITAGGTYTGGDAIIPEQAFSFSANDQDKALA